MTSEPSQRAGEMLNKAIQKIGALKRAAVEARDYGAITDNERLVRLWVAILSGGRVSSRKTGEPNQQS